jgi:hypothetical protein
LKRSDHALAVCLLVLGACTRLPGIPSGECGNGVIEPPEDCDSFPPEGGGVCREQGSLGECHLDCTVEGGGTCPPGWGCEVSGICRPPTGGFEPVRDFEIGSASVLASGDFDGDGRADVMSLETPDPIGVTRLAFHYFDERASLTDSAAFPREMIAPVLTMLPGDTLSDVVFTDSRVGVLLGRADRSWVPETFSSYRVPGGAVRTLSVSDGPVQDTSGFAVFTSFQGVVGIYVPDALNNGLPRLLAPLDAPIDSLVGDPIGGKVIEASSSPCKQIVLAKRGDTAFSLFDVCAQDAVNGAAIWREEPVELRVALDPPQPIAFNPKFVDLNGDAHLDVLVGSAERLYAAYGDGLTLANAVPYEVPVAREEAELMVGRPRGMPLAAGDVTGDGAPDFVFDDRVLLSAPNTTAGFDYFAALEGTGPWSAALIADLNANGAPDIVAVSNERPGVTFLNGTATRDMTGFVIRTARPVNLLATGDFDGDLIEDLAFTQDGPSDVSVMIGYGQAFGPPLTPARVARLENIEQMQPFRNGLLSSLTLSSGEEVEGERIGVLTLLEGSGDRIPVALYDLTTFGADSSAIGSASIRVLAGGFVSSTRDDVLALGFKDNATNPELEYWLLPALKTSAGTPILLAGALPPDLHPLNPTGDAFRIALGAADVDGDGLDDAVMATPAEDDERCGISVLGVDRTQVFEKTHFVLPEPCTKVELLPLDADGDGAVDLAFSTGRADGSARRLSVFWNIGGTFSEEARSFVSLEAEPVHAFTALPGTPMRGVSFAYANDVSVQLVTVTPGTRNLEAAREIGQIEGCTGMTAADLNGDGAVDLALASGGNLNVLRASLEAL